MNELLDWIRAQKGGIDTYLGFQRRALALRSEQPDHAAVCRLLADLAGRFVDNYYGEPLPADVSDKALANLRECLEGSLEAYQHGRESYIQYLNEIAMRDGLER